jgi:hypothetical protein
VVKIDLLSHAPVLSNQGLEVPVGVRPRESLMVAVFLIGHPTFI